MANDREQKIRDVYEALLKAVPNAPPGFATATHIMARAAVDVLDPEPVKRIELSGGFHAEPPLPGPSAMHRIYGKNNTALGYAGGLSKVAVEAWWNATEDAKDVENLRKANDELKQRIATLGRIIEALDGSVPEWS